MWSDGSIKCININYEENTISSVKYKNDGEGTYNTQIGEILKQIWVSTVIQI